MTKEELLEKAFSDHGVHFALGDLKTNFTPRYNAILKAMEQYANQKVQELQKENELLKAEVQRLKTKLETLAHLRELREKFKK